MARKVITTTEYTDDLDGGRAEGSVEFSYNGTNYEIDLSKSNARAFEKALKPYVDAARRVRGTRGRARSGNTRRTDLSEVRAWAKANGYNASDRGRIPGDVISAYDQAK